MEGFVPPNIQKNPIAVPGLIPDLMQLGQTRLYESDGDTNRSASLIVYRPKSQKLAPL